MRKEDIPENDRNSLIYDKLLNYKDILMKNWKDVFNLIIEGKLGTINKQFVDALYKFFHSNENYKTETLNGLK